MTPAAEFSERLCRATNSHDLDALVECFSDDYKNEAPAHPERGFTGREQVRANWQQIFQAVPDVEAEVLRQCVDGEVVWSEWEMRGTRRDGSAHLMRGVIVFGVQGDTALWARFYLEPVQQRAETVDQAIRAQVLADQQ